MGPDGNRWTGCRGRDMNVVDDSRQAWEDNRKVHVEWSDRKDAGTRREIDWDPIHFLVCRRARTVGGSLGCLEAAAVVGRPVKEAAVVAAAEDNAADAPYRDDGPCGREVQRRAMGRGSTPGLEVAWWDLGGEDTGVTSRSRLVAAGGQD